MPSDKLFKTFEEEVISRHTDYNWTDVRLRNPKPSWKDLAEKRIAISLFHLNRLKNNLNTTHFCILVGDKDRGKTWLSYALGYDLVKQNKRVKYASVDENFNAEAAWREMGPESQEFRGRDKPETYLIMEDCHLNHEECQELFQKILDEGEVNLRFLFTMRRTGKILLEDIESEDIFYNEGKKLNCIVHLASDDIMKAHVENIIEKFILSNNICSSKEEINNVAVKWGDDLYWVWLRLKSWNYLQGQRLSEVSDDQVYESIWSDRGEIKLSLPARRKVLVPLAVFCQFEGLTVFELVDFIEDNRETLKELRDAGIVTACAKEGYDFISIQDDFANLILSTLLWKDPTFKQCGTTRQIELFRNYLKFNPPNWLKVFQILYRARESEKSTFVKDILTLLWADNEIYTRVREKVKALPLIELNELNDSIIWSEGRTSWKESEKASKIIKHYYPIIKNKIKNSSATTIRRLMKSLSRMVDREIFFDQLKISDYVNIVNKSALNSLYYLLKNTIDSKGVGSSLAKKLGRALAEADLVGLLSREGTSFYRLNGIIRDLLSIDPSSADKFVKKLSGLDLDDLLFQEDPIAVRKGFNKVQTISFFLSRSLSLFPIYRKQIVDKVDGIKWGQLIRSVNFEQGFWLLWNIYISSSETAKKLVQNGTAENLQDKWFEEQDEKFILPLVSILHLCNYEISELPQKIPITK